MRVNSSKKAFSKQSDETGKLPQIFGQKTLLNTRMLDNHYETTVHPGPWIAPGKHPDYAYNFNDSGLGFMMRNKYDALLQKRREEIYEKNMQYFRNYRELDDIRETDVIVTIEYCTDCKSHNSTTRHDEQKYLNIALQLKKEILNHFPCIKVYLKPNVVDPFDKSIDTVYVRRRIGALEIQIAAGQDNGSIKKGNLHSKLTTGNWPSIAQVLNGIREYMLRTNLSIIVDLQDFDFADVSENNIRNKEVNKLYDIQVILRPFREKRELPQQQQIQQNKMGSQSQLGSPTADLGNSQGEQYFKSNNNRPQSGLSKTTIRPKSAYSTVSNQSMKSLNEQMGQQGGTHGRNKSQEMTEEQLKKAGILKLKTDVDGIVQFKDIPYDVYILEIKESNEYKGFRKKIDIFEKIQLEEPMEENIKLSHLNKTFLIIECFGKNNSYLQIKNAKIQIIPIINNTQDLENSVVDTFNSRYDVTLNPGQYYIEISKKGWIPAQQIYNCKPGQQKIQIGPLEQIGNEEEKKDSNQKPQRRLTGRKDNDNRQLQQQQQQQQQQFQQNSDQQQFNQQQTKQQQQQQSSNSGRPSSAKQKENFDQQQRPISAKILSIFIYDAQNSKPIKGVKIKILEKKLPRKDEDLLTGDDGVCKIKLQNIIEGSIEITHPQYISITEEYGPNKMDLNKFKDLSFPLMQRPIDENEIHLRVLTNIGKRIMTFHVITPQEQIVSQTQDDIEIDNKLEEGQGFLKIKNIIKNKGKCIYRIYSELLEPEHFNPSYLKVYLISHNSMQLIEVPKAFPNPKKKPKYWDIGFVVAPNGNFVEINAPTINEIKKDDYLREYQNLLNFLHTSNSKVDKKQILGFNSTQKMELQDDVLVKEDIIIKNLDDYGFEYSKKISHLLVSAIQLNGLYSFNKLNNKFNSIKKPYEWIEAQQNQDEIDQDEYL